MTRKDLHLSLDNNRAQAHNPHGPAHPKVTELSVAPKPGKKTNEEPPGLRRNTQTVILTAIAFLNLAALLIAGFWFYSVQPGTPPPRPDNTAQLNSILAALEQQSAATATQLEELRQALEAHQQGVMSALLETRQTIDLATRPVASSKDDVSANEIPQPVANWYINLGTFPSLKTATAVQEQLRKMGLEAVIDRRNDNDKTVFDVQASGFEDRESAELASGRIMEKTNLNGLWVWKQD